MIGKYSEVSDVARKLDLQQERLTAAVQLLQDQQTKTELEMLAYITESSKVLWRHHYSLVSLVGAIAFMVGTTSANDIFSIVCFCCGCLVWGGGIFQYISSKFEQKEKAETTEKLKLEFEQEEKKENNV